MNSENAEFQASIWSSCEELRDGMNVHRFGGFVLVLLFVKIISDWCAKDSMYPVAVPEGARFSDLLALKGAPGMGRQINDRILKPLAKSYNLTGLPDFTEMEMWGGSKLGIDRLTRLIDIFHKLDFSGGGGDGPGQAAALYEYILEQSAAGGGAEGHHHTPAEVRSIAAGVTGVSKADEGTPTAVFDPVCGSGSLLLAVAATAGWKNDLQMLLFGQDKDVSSVCLARMRMIVHGYFTARIRWGNILTNPLFRDGASLRTFDHVIAHPPFSDSSWTKLFDPSRDPDQRFAGYGVPPASRGDYAYLLIVLHALGEAGRGVCILPYDALSRGSSEADIRRSLIRRGSIKGVIGLPNNLFPGYEGAACIIVLERSESTERDSIFMIDASHGFVKENGKKRLREKDVTRVTEVFERQTEVEGFSRMVPVREIGSPENDYDLDVSRYIAPKGALAPPEAAALPHAGQPEVVRQAAKVRTPTKRKARPVLERAKSMARGPWPFLAITGILVLFAAIAYVLFKPVDLPVEEAQHKTDVEITQQVERTLSEWAAFQALKQHYPKDYEALVDAMKADLFLAVPKEKALARAMSATAEVRRREARNYGMASVETLRRDLRGRLAVMRHVKAVFGPRACNELAVKGVPALMRFLGERYWTDKDLLKLMDGLTGHFLETASEGQRLQLSHKELSAANWQAVARHLLSMGMTEKDFGVFADPAKSIEDPAACDVFMLLIERVTAPGGDLANGLIPFMATAAAAEK
jgi:type I restriction system adenine methylase HsdM